MWRPAKTDQSESSLGAHSAGYIISHCESFVSYHMLILLHNPYIVYAKEIWAAHNKTYKIACALSERSDQPGNPPSLIRVFALRTKKARICSYSLSAQRTPIRLGGCPGWPVSSLGAHAILFVLSCDGSVIFAVIIEKKAYSQSSFQRSHILA